MKNRAEFRTLVLLGTGDDSSEMIAMANEAINQAIILGALMFDPPELQVKYDHTLPGSEDSFSLAAAPFNGQILIIRHMWDADNGRRLWYVPFDRWDLIVPTVDHIKFYTLHGMTVYLNTSIVPSLNLYVKATKYPTPFVDDVTDCEYDFHDEFIVSTATGLVFAKEEEKDTVDMWSKIQGAVAGALGVGAIRRREATTLMVEKKE